MWVEEESGPIRIWQEPREGVPYVLGGDIAGEGADWFTDVVIDNNTGEQVATLRQKYSEPEYAEQIYALGRYYNDALVGLETNFSTYSVQKLQEWDYPNQYHREREDTYTRQTRKSYGFRTGRQTRPRAVANLVEVFSSHPTWFYDKGNSRRGEGVRCPAGHRGGGASRHGGCAEPPCRRYRAACPR